MPNNYLSPVSNQTHIGISAINLQQAVSHRSGADNYYSNG